MTSVTVNLDDVTAQALDRLVTPGASREEAVVIALQEFLYRRERVRRRAQAEHDGEILAQHAEAELRRAAALVDDQDEP